MKRPLLALQAFDGLEEDPLIKRRHNLASLSIQIV